MFFSVGFFFFMFCFLFFYLIPGFTPGNIKFSIFFQRYDKMFRMGVQVL